VVPAQYLLSAADAAGLTEYVRRGGTLVVSYFAAVVDEHDAVHAGGFGAVLSEVLGLRVEELLPLREGESADVTWLRGASATLSGDVWQEHVVPTTAEVVAAYAGGPGADLPAITRNALGSGVGWYISTRLSADALATVMRDVYADAGVAPTPRDDGLEVVVRTGAAADFVVAINHGERAASVDATGTELLSGAVVTGTIEVPGGGVAVIRRPHGEHHPLV
jgi:beta-galactosidase